MAAARETVHTACVGSALTIDRVRSDIEVLARAGLDVTTFLAECDASIRRAVPYDSMCVSLQDPATSLATATFKFGAIADEESHDLHWCEVEFGGADPTSFRDLARRPTASVGMHLETDGDVNRSHRMRDFMGHHFSYTDELRTVARIDDRVWGAFAMMRGDEISPFGSDEVTFMSSIAEALGSGLRTGVLARCASVLAPTDVHGPAVIVIRSDDTMGASNPSAAHWLAELGGCDNSEGPVHTLAALVDAARRYARGETDVPARSRVRAPSGRWLVLHCSPLSGASGAGTDVVVTIEEARPPEIVPLVVAAFGLTPRERDVTELVLQGEPSKDIAAALHISVHTVQDHLKSVFEKADVRSRRDLIARVFFDQYAPRIGTDLAPSGWFASPGAFDH